MKNQEAVPIDTKRILVTIEEREKWLKRKEELKAKVKELPWTERRHYRVEMERIDKEILYYDGLIREMKGEMRPGDAKSFLNELIKF